MDKDKWKMFPCKTCIINKLCNEFCYDTPNNEQVDRHIMQNKYECICLGCGSQTPASLGYSDGCNYNRHTNGCQSNCNHCTKDLSVLI